ncbi:MAG TPA: hypothetical protein VNX02_13570 [Steroidobacteraceae bacterium]|jgi:hypothetical protein|nr:hypothetical protein [Steroidobacteraceae bacterium]
MTVRHRLSALLLVLTLGASAAAFAGDSVSKVMGSITIAAGEHAGNLATVNGSIDIGDNAVVEHAHTVNGSVRLAEHAGAGEVETVNGSIHLHEGAHVSGRVHTVNGSLSLEPGAEVGERLSNVNGSMHVHGAHVGGEIETVTGSMEIGPDARIDGGIHVRRDESSDSGHRGMPRIVIGPGSVVKGTLRFERPVELYVSDRASIGPVEGATAIKFNGDHPPVSERSSD